MAYNLLKGKRGIIFGALNEQSIAWKVAERAVEEGAEIVLTNTAVAIRMGTIDQLAEKTKATVIAADATSVADLENLFTEAQKALGGKIDFVLHSCAMSANMRTKRTYDDLDYDLLNKTYDISAISFHKMLLRVVLFLLLPTLLHSVHSSATTIWLMPSHCSRASHAASATSTAARRAFV